MNALPLPLSLGTRRAIDSRNQHAAPDRSPNAPCLRPQATPFVGKSAVYLADAASPDPPTQLTEYSRRTPNSPDWPNDLTVAPTDWIAGYPTPLAVIGSGFLVPSHKTGGIWVIEPSAKPEFLQKPVKISKDKEDYFFHLAERARPLL